MGYKKLLPAIVALLVIASVVSISTTVIATHDIPTVSITPALVREGKTYTFTLRVTNNGGDKIDNITITLPPGFSDLRSVAKIPADNVVQLGPGTENQVWLPAGTIVKAMDTVTVELAENLIVERENQENMYWVVAADNVTLRENASVKLQVTGNADNLVIGENLQTAVRELVTLADNRVRLVADTQVVVLGSGVYKLPDNTLVKLITAENAENKPAGDNLILTRKVKLTLMTNNYVTAAEDIDARYIAGGTVTIPEGDNLQLRDDNDVWVLAGTTVKLVDDLTVELAENLQVIRKAEENVYIGENVKTQPENWTFDGTNQWRTENAGAMIAAGGYLDIPFGAKTSSDNRDNRFTITTEDNSAFGSANRVRSVETTIAIDNTAPSVTTTVSADYAKAAASVGITVTASEVLAKAPYVYVRENNVGLDNAKENFRVSMSSTDNKVWTGTYTVINENLNFDGTATVTVPKENVEDVVGHTAAADSTKTFTVDTLAPPSLNASYGLCTLPTITNQSSQIITGRGVDNVAGTVDNYSGLTIKIQVGTATPETTTSGTDNKFSRSINLSEGSNTVKVWVVDKAGNEGPENAQTVLVDTVKPSISITSPTTPTNDNTPTVSVTISDATLGVENENYGSVVAKGGYRVELRRGDNTVIAELKNSQPHVKNTLVFENTYPTELVDNWYNIFVIAGDNLNADNAYLRFYIDTGAPSINTAAALNPLYGTSLGSPKILTTTSVTISGTAEAGATIKVYVNGTEQTAASTTARSDGTWDITVSVTSGVTSKIEVTATDAAGNESAKLLLGYAMADASAPMVTITSPVDGLSTSESSVEVSGSVTKDAWETYSGISVTLAVAGRAGAVTVPLSATGTFSIAVSLSEGGNTIIVTARDAVGNSGSASRTVTRTVTPWGTYAIILVIVALILSAVAIFKKR